MQKFRNFDNWILIFDAEQPEQVYLRFQVTNLKNREVKANPTSQTLKKSLNPKPWTPNSL